MEWTHTLTIIFSIVGSTYAFYTMIQKDIARHDDELKDMRQEFSKRDALWADLLKQIHEIKLFQVSKE
jgi:hypothetical protein